MLLIGIDIVDQVRRFFEHQWTWTKELSSAGQEAFPPRTKGSAKVIDEICEKIDLVL